MSDSDVLDQIEARHGLKLPAAYRALVTAGHLRDGGAARAEGRVLVLQDLEWFPVADVLAADRGSDVNHGLLPFAQDGAGCVYGFDDQGQVCYAEYAVEVKAPDFGTWLYQELIRLFTWNADAGVAARFGAIAAMARPHLSPAHQAVIDPLAARTPEKRKSGEISLLTPAEAQKLG